MGNAAMTPTQELAGLLLGEPLSAYVAAKRTGGYSWRRIAVQIAADTSDRIRVSGEALRGWYGDEAAA